MNRRSFLRTLGRGAVAVAVLASIPAPVIKAVGLTDAGHAWACERLLKIYNNWSRQHRKPPTVIAVSQWFFNLYESELVANVRWAPVNGLRSVSTSLFFKGAKVTIGSNLKGYDVFLYAVGDE